MSEPSPPPPVLDRRLAMHRHRWVLLFWLATCAVMLAYKWHAIHWLALGDTDDNIRFAQVRDWLGGQGWYDLRQHRLDPPTGFNIHWSRFCDLFLAGLYYLARPVLATPQAWRFSVAIAPMLPMLLAMAATGTVARRLIDDHALPLALAILLCAQTALLMWMPLRIDHHGWQLALLMTCLAGLCDEKRSRGGITVAVASSVAMAIGLETLPYLMFAGAAIALRWVWNRDEAPRMIDYGIALVIGCALAFLIFASYDNRHAVCDAMSPVWLTVSVAGGTLLAGCALVRSDSRAVRLALIVGVGIVIVALYALLFPRCLGRLEGMSPELEKLWLSNVREAKPIYAHPWRISLPIVVLPVTGMIGSGLAAWRERRGRNAANWAVTALFSWFATGLMLWQTRAGPSAQMLAVPGATALGWMVLPRLAVHRWMLVRVLGTVAAFFAISGLYIYFVMQLFPAKAVSATRKANDHNADLCPTLPALRPIARMPRATFFTLVDFGPRLIAMTGQRAVAGPYHRNGQAIIDVNLAFRGSADNAHRIMVAHHADYLLTCPGMAEGTIYQAETPKGFYANLARGQVPAWLTPVALPKGSPFKLWRIAP